MNRRKSELSRQIISKCCITIAVYTIAVIFAVIIAYIICKGRYWYDYEISYWILYWIQEHIISVCTITIAIGWIVIFIRYIRKLLSFLDEIIYDLEKIAAPESGQIHLSTELNSVQYEMNLIREKTINFIVAAKEAESEQARLSAELNSVQNEMNLFREKAINSTAAAKEAEKRKNDLIVYLAHDLKTPLTSIIGYLTLMRDEPDISCESRTKYTGIALDKAQRLEELINEFFDITRFNLTHITLETENLNFTRLIEQTAFEFQPILDEKNLNWEMSIEKDIFLVCDVDKMARVIDNLMKNAINYSYPDTTIKLFLTKNNSKIIFIIENKGKTISEEKLNRIFEQFFRLDSSRGTKSGGAGLGLAIAKEIVQLHNGIIKVQSADETIRFTVELPF